MTEAYYELEMNALSALFEKKNVGAPTFSIHHSHDYDARGCFLVLLHDKS